MPDKIDPSDLDALIDACLEGRLRDPDAARLSAHLVQSAEARARYWETATIHGHLEHVMQNASLQAVTGQAMPAASRPQRWVLWRPLPAVALGLVIGLFSASLVFGFVAQGGKAKKVPLMVFEPGFEKPQLPVGSGFPVGSGQWSGDAAQVVATENGVTAKEGAHMLRLEAAVKGAPRIYQVLDLQSLPSDPWLGLREIEVSASFAAADSTAAARYFIRAFAVTEAPPMLDSTWFDRRDESIASAARGLDVTPGESGWQTFSVRLQVPRPARSLVLFFGARTPDKAARTSPHYLDDVRVSLFVP